MKKEEEDRRRAEEEERKRIEEEERNRREEEKRKKEEEENLRREQEKFKKEKEEKDRKALQERLKREADDREKRKKEQKRRQEEEKKKQELEEKRRDRSNWPYHKYIIPIEKDVTETGLGCYLRALEDVLSADEVTCELEEDLTIISRHPFDDNAEIVSNILSLKIKCTETIRFQVSSRIRLKYLLFIFILYYYLFGLK